MIALLPFLLLAGEPAPDCDNAVTQMAMNQCAQLEYTAADAELNAQWKITSAAMKQRDANLDREYDSRPGYFETLLAAQRAWLAYRDNHCRSAGYFARGGSMEPMLVSFCLAKLTAARTEQLKELVETY